MPENRHSLATRAAAASSSMCPACRRSKVPPMAMHLKDSLSEGPTSPCSCCWWAPAREPGPAAAAAAGVLPGSSTLALVGCTTSREDTAVAAAPEAVAWAVAPGSCGDAVVLLSGTPCSCGLLPGRSSFRLRSRACPCSRLLLLPLLVGCMLAAWLGSPGSGCSWLLAVAHGCSSAPDVAVEVATASRSASSLAIRSGVQPAQAIRGTVSRRGCTDDSAAKRRPRMSRDSGVSASTLSIGRPFNKT
mmetsp:Transcript_27151/g.59280  ORF Transcript_27151/g.59280 Transcript_27151/m.59280 type:complete len:246 (+) Transcript_27151:801-1538(+)